MQLDTMSRLAIVSETPQRRNDVESKLEGEFELAALPSKKRFFSRKQDVLPDLVLLDTDAEDEIATDIARIHHQLKNDSTPVMVIAPHYDPELEARALASGASDYVARGVRASALRERVRTRIQSQHYRAFSADGMAGSAETLGLISSFFQQSPQTMSIRDLGGRYLLVNRAAAGLLGTRPVEFVGKRPEETPGTEQRMEQHDALVRKRGEAVEYERPFLTPQGERQIRLTAFPIRDSAQNLCAIGRIGVEVSDSSSDARARQESTDALNRQHAMLSSFLEHTPCHINLRDLQGRYLMVNSMAAKRIGKPKEEILGRTDMELDQSSRTTRLKIDSHEQAVRESRSAVTKQRWERDGSGTLTERWVQKFPVVDTDDSLLAIGTVDMDITEFGAAQRALSEREENFRVLVEASIQGILIHREMKPLFANQAFANMHGFESPEEILALETTRGLIAPEDRARLEEYAATRDSKNAPPAHYEYKAVRKNGSIVILQCSVSTTKWQNTPAHQTAVIDVTEQRIAEIALRTIKARLSAFFEHAPHGMAIKSLDGRYLEVNDAAAKFVDRTKEDLLGRRASDFFAAVDADIIAQREAEVANSGNVVEYEHAIQMPGRQLVLYSVIFPILDSTGAVSAIGRTSTDVTESKLAEDELRVSAARLSAFFSNSPHAMSIQAPDGRYLEENEGSEQLYGFSTSAVRGKLPQEIWSPDIAEKVEVANRQVRNQRESVQYENEVQVGDVRKWIHVAKFPIQDVHQNLLGIGSIGTDISNWKHAEAKLRQSRRRFRDFAEASSDWFWEMGPELTFTSVTEQGAGPVSELALSNLNATGDRRRRPRGNGALFRRWQSFWTLVRNHHVIRNLELPLINAAGELRYIRTSGKPIWDDVDGFKGYRGVATDVTDAVESQNRANMLMEAIEQASEAVVIYDDERRFAFTNKEYHRIFPHLPSKEAIIGMSRVDGVRLDIEHNFVDHPLARSNPEEYLRTMSTWGDSDESLYGELTYRTGRTYLRRFRRIGEASALVLLTDITERKQAQRELESYQAELRRLASEVSLAGERERRRIATELHDGAAQNLGLANVRIGILRQKLNDPELANELDQLRSMVAQSVRELRSLMSELSPPMLYELGLSPALRWLAQRFSESYALECKVVASDEDAAQLSNDLTVLLFQAARELLMNVAKHAKAKHVSVELKQDHDRLTLRICDDGVGIDPAQLKNRPSDSGGFGLFSIRERVGLVHGAVSVNLTDPGTAITITVPRESRHHSLDGAQ